jgi:hypothetical protein
MEIEFQGQYDKATLFKAVQLANKPSKRNTILRISFAVLIVALFVAYAIAIANKDSLSSFEIFRSGRHLITIPFLLYFLLQPYISAYQTTNNLWKSPFMRAPMQGVVSSQGIVYGVSVGRTETPWGKFAKKQVTNNLIVLLTDDGILSILPRHFFKTENDWQIVTQWVKVKVIEPI